jgi:hypothetical protein
LRSLKRSSSSDRTRRPLLLSLLALTVLSAPAHADLIINGNFEQTLTNNSAEFGSRYPQQQVTGWTSTGYNFVFLPGTADSTGAASEDGAGLSLWGPGNGSANGLPVSSPAGGNFLAMDGVYASGPISQTLEGLTPGAPFSVTFYVAGAQQFNYSGPTTEQFKVSFDGQDQYTPGLNDASHGFTGWQQQTLTFNTNHATATLSFLALGTRFSYAVGTGGLRTGAVRLGTDVDRSGDEWLVAETQAFRHFWQNLSNHR